MCECRVSQDAGSNPAPFALHSKCAALDDGASATAQDFYRDGVRIAIVRCWWLWRVVITLPKQSREANRERSAQGLHAVGKSGDR